MTVLLSLLLALVALFWLALAANAYRLRRLFAAKDATVKTVVEVKTPPKRRGVRTIRSKRAEDGPGRKLPKHPQRRAM